MAKVSPNDIDLEIGKESKYTAAERAEMNMRARDSVKRRDKENALQQEAKKSNPPATRKTPSGEKTKPQNGTKAPAKKNTAETASKGGKKGAEKTLSSGSAGKKGNGATQNNESRGRKVVKVKDQTENKNTEKKPGTKSDKPAGNKKAPAASKKNQGSNQKKKAPAEKTAGKTKTNKNKGASNAEEHQSKSERLTKSSNVRRGRTKKFDIFKIAGIVAVALVFIYLFAAYLIFNVKDIVVENPGKKYTDEQITAAAEIDYGSNLLRISASKKENYVPEVLPYIESLSIKKKWPDKVTLTVEYARAEISVKNGNNYVYINATGKVLEADMPAPAVKSAEITGAVVKTAIPGKDIEFEDSHTLENVRILADAVEKNKIKNVTGYDVRNEAEVSIMIDGRIEVKIGETEGVLKKLEFCKKIIDDYLKDDGEKQIIIDLTKSKAAYVRDKKDKPTVFETVPFAEETTGAEIPEPLSPGETPAETTVEGQAGIETTVLAAETTPVIAETTTEYSVAETTTLPEIPALPETTAYVAEVG